MVHPLEQTSFLYGTNATYIAELYASYKTNRESVSSDWRAFFEELGKEAEELFRDDRPPQWREKKSIPVSQVRLSGDTRQEVIDSIRAISLIRSYRVRGHLGAHFDPLGLEERAAYPDLDPRTYGFTDQDWDREIFLNYTLGLEKATLRQIIDKLKQTYCQRIGVEFMHIQDPHQRNWIQEQVENNSPYVSLSNNHRLNIFKDLVRAESFEKFLHVKYPGAKRFGLEGGESLIPALEVMLQDAVSAGVRTVVFGMAHRGRLSVLANVLNKPMRLIFAKFQGDDAQPDDVGSGDVKYHLGYSTERLFDDHHMHLSLISNPSHLEAVDPVVLGKVRAEQMRVGDDDRQMVMGVLMHGDAAFAGQGLVAETLELSGLKGYRTGGTLHIIINNQIGFTTSPPHSRSSPYSSDIAKAIQAPIFHVNGDDPEAVAWVMKLACEFRRRFKQDVVVDLICYRRHGHNEMDEPAFTQPKMYKAIAKHPTTRTLYEQALKEKGILTEADIAQIHTSYEAILQEEFKIAMEQSQKLETTKPAWLAAWETDGRNAEESTQIILERVKTGVPHTVLKEIGAGLARVPKGFNLNSKISKQLEIKKKQIDEGHDIDWATGEALAIGSLLLEGNSVRLSGQDCGRGTFSQRHAVWVDQGTEEKYVPLNHLRKDQAQFEIVDSPLAEASVLGFEYGYSITAPDALVMWEAQFGDFANGAQVIIDQFIASGEAKWMRLSGVTLLLPHGYEGQGPEHSSARIERYLQLCAESNMQVMTCSTPANYFHALRRQVRSEMRKPLIIFTPKSLLRHKLAVSPIKEMEEGTSFISVYGDDKIAPTHAKRVVLCSGKIYYELLQERDEKGIKDVAIFRLEQYYPFPSAALTEHLKLYKQAELVWCQEEPMNMGAWMFLDRRLERILEEIGASKTRPIYVGRPAAASPSTGMLGRHQAEQEEVVRQALVLEEKVARGVYAI